eukprot:12289694-Alexandrium_andersonii.AAC.1
MEPPPHADRPAGRRLRAPLPRRPSWLRGLALGSRCTGLCTSGPHRPLPLGSRCSGTSRWPSSERIG